MTRKANSNPLADRLAALEISPAELAAIVGRPVETVEAWLTGTPDAEAEILTRFLADDADAMRRVGRVRHKQTRPLQGEDWQTATIDIPYGGGYEGTDAIAGTDGELA